MYVSHIRILGMVYFFEQCKSDIDTDNRMSFRDYQKLEIVLKYFSFFFFCCIFSIFTCRPLEIIIQLQIGQVIILFSKSIE